MNTRMLADAVAALDRPDPVGVFAAGGEHRLIAIAVGAEPALAQDAFALVNDLDSRGSLVRVYADDDRPMWLPLPRTDDGCRREGSAGHTRLSVS